VENEKAREMFLSLAEDEKKHAAMIRRQIRALREEGHFAPEEGIEAPKAELAAKLFPPEKKASAASALEALHTALEVEAESYNLYYGAAQEEDDPAGKQLYLWLAAAERSHFDLLMSNYEAWVSQGGWV